MLKEKPAFIPWKAMALVHAVGKIIRLFPILIVLLPLSAASQLYLAPEALVYIGKGEVLYANTSPVYLLADFQNEGTLLLERTALIAASDKEILKKVAFRDASLYKEIPLAQVADNRQRAARVEETAPATPAALFKNSSSPNAIGYGGGRHPLIITSSNTKKQKKHDSGPPSFSCNSGVRPVVLKRGYKTPPVAARDGFKSTLNTRKGFARPPPAVLP